MTKIIEPRTLPGFRDFLPETMRIRNRCMGIFREVFEKYGFEPLETPALEYQDILLGKYGEEAEKLMYLFKDRGGRDVGLRYDLTVPAARILAQYPTLPKPFKRYQIQPAWRAEKPQRGRYREFTQCDIDTFGSSSPLADAEIIAVISECLQKVGFKKFFIRLNSRQVLFKLMGDAGVPKDKYLTAIQALDKLDKKPEEEVRLELAKTGSHPRTIAGIFQKLKEAKPDDDLNQILGFLEKLAVPKDFYKFDPALARGLDYYTGSIFETAVSEPKIGSITGGGRYDNLIGQFMGQNIPAVGTTIGLDRVVDVISELGLWGKSKPATCVLVTVFSPVFLDKSLEITKWLRGRNINAEIYLAPETKLDRQLKYGDQKGIPFALIIGPEEAEKNLVTLKNMQSKTQETLDIDSAIAKTR